jgi:hypothetical protein
MNETEHVIPP